MLKFSKVEELENLVAAATASARELTLEESIAAAHAVGRIALWKLDEGLACVAQGVFRLIPRGALAEAWSVMMAPLAGLPEIESVIKLIHPRVAAEVVTRGFGVPVGRAGLNCAPSYPPEAVEGLRYERGEPPLDPLARSRFLELRSYALAAKARAAVESLR